MWHELARLSCDTIRSRGDIEYDELPQRGNLIIVNVLLVGSGGREHTIAWKLAQSEQVSRVYVAPGNGGTTRLNKTENVAISVDDLRGLLDFARARAIDLTVVGPEAPLVAGLVDVFTAAGLAAFGPCQAAAQLEGSKAFSKQFMTKHGIPTGWAESFTDFEAAMDFLHTLDELPVIKASGLAAGKGVILPATVGEAAETLRAIMLEGRFSDAGKTTLIEERLTGPELSVLAFCDGKTLHIMPPAQDHKRLRDGDRGPNTGGMGAFTPSTLATPALLAEVERTVLRPTLDGMAAAGTPYVGVLYAGLMLTADGPKVLEFNCRFGDPETQVVLPLLESDLTELFSACLQGRLAEIAPRWSEAAAATVVMAAGGYPDAYAKGLEITGVDNAEAADCTIFHAGTKLDGARLLSDGGRVLAVTALGTQLDDAVARAYRGVAHIHFDSAIYRTDIGR